MADEGLLELLERTTICVSGSEAGAASHHGDVGFQKTIGEHYTVQENNAVEKLVRLKTKLRDASTYDFWRLLMDGMTDITGSQYGFAAKRMLADDHDTAVEMPSLGEPGSCLMGVAFYYNDGHQMKQFFPDYKYMAYGAPCEYMKHDKIFLIPNGMPHFIPRNPNQLPFPAEAYLGIPLFAEGKCFGHFGMMWTTEGLSRQRLSWAYIELLLHSLEDVIRERLLEGRGYAKPEVKEKPIKVIPAETVPASQSLKPYARSLSHELRTPMQGVVGMLDVMYATVQESLESPKDATMDNVLKTLRDNIEVVQDSSRRAVEAADNVVHAYDLDMQIPDTPVPPNDDESPEVLSNKSRNTHLLSPRQNGAFKRGKRPRASDSMERHVGPAPKHRLLKSPKSPSARTASPHTQALKSAVEEIDNVTGSMDGVIAGTTRSSPKTPLIVQQEAIQGLAETEEPVATPGLRHTRIRELLHLVINESLRVGGRPDSAVAEDTDGGEIIEVRTRGPDGELQIKMIEWSVDARIPEMIFVDERDLAKLVSCVFLNAVKFTEEGTIIVRATLSSRARFVVINVTDTGSGIPEAFQPYLFQPFAREDDSLTRQKEGLGLGLLVAKGLARKIGGEVACVRSSIDGPSRGSEFELRVPLHASETPSRPCTPSRTPSPTRRTNHGLQSPRPTRRDSSFDGHSPRSIPAEFAPKSPRPLAKAVSPPHIDSLSTSQIQPAPPPTVRRPSTKQPPSYDSQLGKKHPLSFLVVEDNSINRRLLVNMLGKLGYTTIHEAHDGVEAVHQMRIDRLSRGERPIDVILMDLWMPNMDGYEATEKILRLQREKRLSSQRNRRISTQRVYSMKETSDVENDDTEEDTDLDTRTHIHQKHAVRGDGNDYDGDDDDQNGNIDRKKLTVLAVTADVTDSAIERASQVGMEGFMPKPYKLLDLERLILEYCVVDYHHHHQQSQPPQ